MFNIEQQHDQQYKAIKELKEMDIYSQSALSSFREHVNNAYNAFWFGSIHPSVKAEILGTEALNVFTKSAQAQAFIKSQMPEHVELGIPETFDTVWNQDGSVTITDVVVDP